MMTQTKTHPKPRAPWHLWGIGGTFLLLYVGGMYDYFMMLNHNEAYYTSKGFGEHVHEYFANYPLPLLVLWTLNIFSAPIAAILLLTRQRQAEIVALLSAASVVILEFTTFTFRDRWSVLGPWVSLFDLIIVAGGTCGSYLYCQWLRARNIL